MLKEVKGKQCTTAVEPELQEQQKFKMIRFWISEQHGNGPRSTNLEQWQLPMRFEFETLKYGCSSIEHQISKLKEKNTTRVTGIKKLICGKRRDSTFFYEFLRNIDNRTEPVDQLNQIQINIHIS